MEELRSAAIETPKAGNNISERCQQYIDFYFALVGRVMDMQLNVPVVQFSDDAPRRGKHPVIDQIHRLNTAVMEIGQLQKAFNSSPRSKIDGSHGVRSQLGISHNGVYLRIQSLGLLPDDFREPNISLDDLVKRSAKLSKLIEEIDKTIAEMTQKV